jgi:DNA repair photolyase
MTIKAENYNIAKQATRTVDIIDVYQGEFRVNGEHITNLSDLKLQGKRIILGSAGDPLFPFEAKFENFLALLLKLGEHQFESLHITTCSPLLLVALPILKNLGERLQVSLKVYSEQDLVKRVNPRVRFPRKKEVYQLAKVLRENNIEVNLKSVIGVP